MVMKVDVHSACTASLMRFFAIWLVSMKYITAIKTQNSKFELPWYLRREKPALPYNMVIQLDVHSVFIANFKSIQDHLLSGWWQ